MLVTRRERDTRKDGIAMNGTIPNSTVRELDSRTNDDIAAWLLWNPLTDFVSVRVDDGRYGQSFEFYVAPAPALEAFRHPFSHAGAN
jgi:hypothetical protein